MVETVSGILAGLVMLCWVFIACSLILWILSLASESFGEYFAEYRDFVGPVALPAAFLVALVAMSGSLFYSEYANFIPCQLCWYQRIGIYPQTLILLVANITRDRSVKKYVIPLALITSIVSIWHILVERFPTLEGVLKCTTGVPCTTIYVDQLGFITIPVMALTASLTIVTLMLFMRKRQPEEAESGTGFKPS